MRKILDNCLDFFRRTSLLKVFESSENWIVKIGLISLYFAAPAVISLICIKMMINFGWSWYLFWAIPGSAIACFLVGYIAEKMLDYVKPSITQAKTNIVSKSFLDILALCAAFGGLACLINAHDFSHVYSFSSFVFEYLIGIFAFVVLEYVALLLLKPESFGVRVDANATPTQSLITILSLVLKTAYRIVPVVFGGLMILFVFFGFVSLFDGSMLRFVGLESFTSVAFLPLIAYFVFSWAYWMLDFFQAIFRTADAAEKIAEGKSTTKSK
ncbi:MAG: hypothetical protein K5912_02755 [Alphaproteobacteria bacterium]|nr:hypothetical protein [Alphaproteobacteria bacterium]